MVTQFWILLFLLLALFALLDCMSSVSRYTRLGRDLPLRGIFQGVKLVASILVGILMIALLLGKSPLFLFSGLGAMTAVLMLVFKDPSWGWWRGSSSPPTACSASVTGCRWTSTAPTAR